MAAAATPPDRPAPVVRRIKLRFTDVETFIATFAPNVARNGIFLHSKMPRPVGTDVRFEVRLADDQVMLVGVGVVRHVTAEPPANIAGGRTAGTSGMTIAFARITKDSRELITRIIAYRKEFGFVDGPGGLPQPYGTSERAARARRESSRMEDAEAAAMTPSSAAISPIIERSTPMPEPLAPEPPRRPRIDSVNAYLARAAQHGGGDTDLTGDNGSSANDVDRAMAKARRLVGAKLDDELARLLDPNENETNPSLDVDEVSVKLAAKIGAPAVARQKRSTGSMAAFAAVPRGTEPGVERAKSLTDVEPMNIENHRPAHVELTESQAALRIPDQFEFQLEGSSQTEAAGFSDHEAPTNVGDRSLPEQHAIGAGAHATNDPAPASITGTSIEVIDAVDIVESYDDDDDEPAVLVVNRLSGSIWLHEAAREARSGGKTIPPPPPKMTRASDNAIVAAIDTALDDLDPDEAMASRIDRQLDEQLSTNLDDSMLNAHRNDIIGRSATLSANNAETSLASYPTAPLHLDDDDDDDVAIVMSIGDNEFSNNHPTGVRDDDPVATFGARTPDGPTTNPEDIVAYRPDLPPPPITVDPDSDFYIPAADLSIRGIGETSAIYNTSPPQRPVTSSLYLNSPSMLHDDVGHPPDQILVMGNAADYERIVEGGDADFALDLQTPVEEPESRRRATVPPPRKRKQSKSPQRAESVPIDFEPEEDAPTPVDVDLESLIDPPVPRPRRR